MDTDDKLGTYQILLIIWLLIVVAVQDANSCAGNERIPGTSVDNTEVLISMIEGGQTSFTLSPRQILSLVSSSNGVSVVHLEAAIEQAEAFSLIEQAEYTKHEASAPICGYD